VAHVSRRRRVITEPGIKVSNLSCFKQPYGFAAHLTRVPEFLTERSNQRSAWPGCDLTVRALPIGGAASRTTGISLSKVDTLLHVYLGLKVTHTSQWSSVLVNDCRMSSGLLRQSFFAKLRDASA
jgi:hypothetical protein